MSLSRYTVLRLILLFLWPAASLHPQLLQDPRMHSLVLQGIDQTLRQDYRAAEQTFQTMIVQNPQHPAGYLYLAGMLQAKNTDYGDWFDEKRYDSLLNIVEMLSEPMIDAPLTAAVGHYYTGSAEAFRSYTRSENGNLPAGVYYGLAAGRSMEECLRQDPSFVEAKNILGAFYYWSSMLAWIPFVPNRSREGIAYIKESSVHPYEKHLASHNLMVILTEEKEFAEAEKYGLQMLSEYPENRLFLMNLLTVYDKWNRPNELLSVVNKLLNSTLSAPVVNRYTEAVCRMKLARFAAMNNDKASAQRELRRVLELKKFIGTSKGNLRKKVAQAEEMLRTIE